MKKKLVTLLLSLCCLCGAAGLNACGGGEENSSQSSAQSGESTSTSVDEGNSSQESSVPEDAPAPATEGLAYELSDDETYYIVAGIGTATDTDLVIPATHNELPVKEIGYAAFVQNPTIHSVYMGENITSIGEGAFAYSSLASVVISDSVTTISSYAFSACENLTSVVIPDSVTTISSYVFFGSKNLTSVTIPDTVTTIEISAFDYCDNLMQEEGGVFYVDKWAIKGEPSLTSVSLRENTRGIAENAFVDCRITELVIPDSVAFIGVHSFISCNALTSVTLGKGVVSISAYAFSDCRELTSIVIPEGVTSIGRGAFGSCENLTAVTFENTSGWTVDGTALSSDDLADTQKAAEYLTDTYYEKLWTRVDE